MKVGKLADLRITNENVLVITKQASWWMVGYSSIIPECPSSPLLARNTQRNLFREGFDWDGGFDPSNQAERHERWKRAEMPKECRGWPSVYPQHPRRRLQP